MINHILSYFLLLSLAFSPLLSAQQSSAAVRPGTILLSAYQTVNDAEKLEDDKQHKEAWNKYQQALRYYQSLSAAHPEWKPHIVKRRIRSTTEAIARVEPMAQRAFMLEQAKIQDFVGQSGDPSQIAAAPSFTNNPQNLKALSRLNEQLQSQQRQLEDLKNKHTSEKLALTEQVASLERELRKQQQGLGEESTQSRILNGEIAKLQAELRRSEQLGQQDQQKLVDTIEKLQRTRTALATAPLRQDVEKLQRQKDQQEQELRLLAMEQQRTQRALKIKTLDSQQAQRELKTTKALLAKKTQLLEDSQKNTKAVVDSMRREISTLKSKLSAAEAKIAEQGTEIADLINRLAESESVTDELRNELANMTAERDQLSEMLQLSDADRAKELMEENLRLGQELGYAKRNLAQLSVDKNAALDRVIEAENTVAFAKQQLINIRQENTAFRKRISNLEDTLKTTQEQLAQLSSETQGGTQSDPAAREEADLLKQTVKRLLAQSSRRRQAERMLWQEYQKSAQADPAFVKKYNEFSASDLQLTSKELDILSTKQSDGAFYSPHARASRQQQEKAQAKADGQIASYHSIAKRFIEKENYEIAKDIFDEAYDTIPDYSFLINRGVVRMRLNEFEEAQEIFELGASQRPRSPYTHFMLGLSRFELGNDDLAAKSMDRALDLKPDHKIAMLYRGLIEAKNGREQKALEFLEKAIQIDPEFAMAHFNQAVLHNMMNDNKKARESYNNALRSGLAPNMEFEKTIGIHKG